MIDKARASAAGTIHDYIYPCPLDKGVFQRWGITPGAFTEAIRGHQSDGEIVAWLRQRVGDEQREAANRWLVEQKGANLDRQDAEEGAIAA